MGGRINVNGQNVQCRSTGTLKMPAKRKSPREKAITPYKMPNSIYDGYRYHRRGNYKAGNGEIKTYVIIFFILLFYY